MADGLKLPPGATLVDPGVAAPPTMKLPPGASLVSSGTPAPSGPGGIDPSKVAGADATGMGLPAGGSPAPNEILNPRPTSQNAIDQSIANQQKQKNNFYDQRNADVSGAVKGGIQSLKDWYAQPASLNKYVAPVTNLINMGGAMVTMPYEAAGQAVFGHPIEAAQTFFGADEDKAKELDQQGNTGGADWERYGKPLAFMAGGEAGSELLGGVIGGVKNARFENSNFANLIKPGFNSGELPYEAAENLRPFYKQEAAAMGMKDEGAIKQAWTGQTPTRNTSLGLNRPTIPETVTGMQKVRDLADRVVDRIDSRVNGPDGVMSKAENDPVPAQTKESILSAVMGAQKDAGDFGSVQFNAYKPLIEKIENAKTFGEMNQIKKTANNMIEGVLHGKTPSEQAAAAAEPIMAWKNTAGAIRDSMYPDLQKYVAPKGSSGYFDIADTGRLEGQAMDARDGIYKNYYTQGMQNVSEGAKSYLENLGEGSLYKSHILRRALDLFPTPAGKFNLTFHRGLGKIGEGTVPETLSAKTPQLKLPPPVQPPPSYDGQFNVPTGAPVEPTQVTPSLPQKYLGTMQVPNPDYTPLEGPSHFQQQKELGYKNLDPGRGRDIPLPPNANSGQLYGGHVADTIPDSVRGSQSPARQRADQIGLGHVQGPAGQPGSAKPIAGINPPPRSLTGPETMTASNWQYLTGSAEPPQMVGHNGAAVMTTSDPSIAKSALDGMRNYQDTQGFKNLPKAEQKLHADALDKLDKQYAAYKKWQASNPLPPPPGVEPKFEVWLNQGKTGKAIASRMKTRIMANEARMGVQGVVSGKSAISGKSKEQRQSEEEQMLANQPQ